jgi:hypothetical protein
MAEYAIRPAQTARKSCTDAWIAPVKVRVTDVPVEHEVKMKDFKEWIERRGNTPKDVMDRKKIREILGLPKSL